MYRAVSVVGDIRAAGEGALRSAALEDMAAHMIPQIKATGK